MKRWGLLGGAFLAVTAADPALAAQCATVSFSPGSVAVPAWNPIMPGAQQATFTMTLTRVSSATTGIRIIFTDTNDSSQPVKLGTNGTASGPQYQLLDPSGKNVVYPLNTSIAAVKPSPLIEYQNKGSSNTAQVTFRVYVPANTPGTDFGNGAYGETLNYVVQCTNGGNNSNPIDGPTSGPAVSLTIPNLVSLTTASAATLDFQNFTSLSQQLNVGLKSTGPVNVAIDSTNKLKMVRSGASAPYPDNSTILYSLSLRSVPVPSLPANLTNQPRAGVAGTTWPLVLSLPSTPSGKVAGAYTDTITLTLTPGT
jgi:hypothetical protein